jgi:hypothetical protein
VDTRSQSFLLRVWEERCDKDGQDQVWRGSLEEVQSGKRMYFSTLLELCAFLGSRTGMASPPPGRDRRLARSRHWRTGGNGAE